MSYHQFLAGLQLRHFSPVEITSYGDAVRQGVRNSLPPRDLWPNIVPTLWVVDHLRHLLGVPIVLTSLFRDPDFNRAVGGVSNSQHLRNAAIDFQARGASPRVCYNRLLKLRDAKMFRGGVGLYGTFVHIDTRGRNATW